MNMLQDSVPFKITVDIYCIRISICTSDWHHSDHQGKLELNIETLNNWLMHTNQIALKLRKESILLTSWQGL